MTKSSIPFKTAYGSHERVLTVNDDPSRAKQSFKEECNINTIMEKYQKTGLVDHVRQHEGNYGEFLSSDDYHDALNQILKAQQAFDTLPSSIRKKFNNSPSEFLEFVHDEKNSDELVEMGLANAPPVDPLILSAPVADAIPSGEPETPPEGA